MHTSIKYLSKSTHIYHSMRPIIVYALNQHETVRLWIRLCLCFSRRYDIKACVTYRNILFSNHFFIWCASIRTFQARRKATISPKPNSDTYQWESPLQQRLWSNRIYYGPIKKIKHAPYFSSLQPVPVKSNSFLSTYKIFSSTNRY